MRTSTARYASTSESWLRTVSDRQISEIERALNARPRKCLAEQPVAVFNELRKAANCEVVHFGVEFASELFFYFWRSNYNSFYGPSSRKSTLTNVNYFYIYLFLKEICNIQLFLNESLIVLTN